MLKSACPTIPHVGGMVGQVVEMKGVGSPPMAQYTSIFMKAPTGVNNHGHPMWLEEV